MGCGGGSRLESFGNQRMVVSLEGGVGIQVMGV